MARKNQDPMALARSIFMQTAENIAEGRVHPSGLQTQAAIACWMVQAAEILARNEGKKTGSEHLKARIAELEAELATLTEIPSVKPGDDATPDDAQPLSMQQAADDAESLTTRQAADFLGVKPTTLEAWRQRHKGPVYLKYGSSRRSPVRYRVEDLVAWQERALRQSTSKRARGS